MFQLSEFTDKPVGGTQWKVPFIHMQFNFTLSYITLSPRGRTSHSILHSEPDRASYAPEQLNSFLFSLLFTAFALSLDINTDQVRLYLHSNVWVKN